MTEENKNIPLVGYANRLSVRPKETISFKVSSELKSDYLVDLYRSISADPNPEGIGIKEEKVDNYFSSRLIKSRVQKHFPGSYARSQKQLNLDVENGIKISINFFSTLKNNKSQILISIGHLSIYINENYQLSCSYLDKKISISKPIKTRKWIKAKLELDYLENTLKLLQNYIDESNVELSRKIDIEVPIKKNIVSYLVISAKEKDNKIENFFNGKIEDPEISTLSTERKFEKFLEWDFSDQIPSSLVREKLTDQYDLKIINYPTRGVTGSEWDGSEMSWKYCPQHYRAIHFHEDDIYDFEWENDFDFVVPEDMPSGIYVMRLKCENFEDNIPFFVCPPKNETHSDLCVIIPTFTYTVYGNHARPDYKNSWEEKINKWNAYPHNPANFKHYGLSTYNFHSDGSGICHASYL